MPDRENREFEIFLRASQNLEHKPEKIWLRDVDNSVFEVTNVVNVITVIHRETWGLQICAPGVCNVNPVNFVAMVHFVC